MCGIFGYVGKISEQLASKCIYTLTHRGPDGVGQWQNAGIALGHTRLSILDLSDAGSQPMSYLDGRYWITFNGEIYNFIEIRKELQSKGYRFRSDSDTEVIIAAFIEWGEDCQNKFNGMWALAIWDDVLKKLFLSRDRFGKKPLFYLKCSEGFAFASEMKALIPLLKTVDPNLKLLRNRDSIFRYESTEECLVKGIRRFPSGYCAVLEDQKLNMKRWWCTLDHLIELPRKYDKQVELFRELFLDACKLRMRSDVPIGTALSGGLDSSSTLSAMSSISKGSGIERLSKDWQHAYVACFPGTPFDESEYAKTIAEYHGINSTFINIDPIKAINRLEEYLYLFEDLYITSPIPFMMTYGRVKESGTTVTIDGHGADELFGGYPFDYIYALSDAGLNPNKIYQVLKAYNSSLPKDSVQFKKEENQVSFWVNWLIQNGYKKDEITGIDDNHSNWERLDTLNKILYISTHETILPTLLRNYDRYSMANGVEIRMPFMDHRIVSFAFSIPWTSKIRNGYSKNIIRDAMSPYMPDSIAYRRTKIGFNSPIIDWIKGPLREYFLDVITSSDFKSCNLINPVEVYTKIIKVITLENATISMGEDAWSSISPYLWERAVLRKHAI